MRNPGERWRAVYACDPAASRGRLHEEARSPTRSEFQRDRDRIIHSTAFRRLKHKTQVFVQHEGDHYRTRLTHTLEVSQIARAMARSLGLDEDLAETLALSHDLGHTPFGHAGEEVLQECLAQYGSFDHNAQALKIVTSLERRYARYDGLNLTWETLEGLVKHNGPLFEADGAPTLRYRAHGVSKVILDYNAMQDLELSLFAAGEAQAAALADDIAYDAHDIDDGLRAGLFRLEDLRSVDFLKAILDEIDGLYPGLELQRRIYELTRRVITRFVEDAVYESEKRLKQLAPQNAQAIRHASRAMVAFSPLMAEAESEVKRLLYERMYRHPHVMRVRRQGESIVRDLFFRYIVEPHLLPEEWRSGIDPGDVGRFAMQAGDYIAGMTDNYAASEHRRLFDVTPDLR